ncbi:Metallo-dependent phosphatase-like protein [Amylocarpus encephaloides]|uniref:Metallo-dependent phosphatase-like protein n=1 Tax=Amylocarpus encephaloides TaxID=45428 RepID=A0A9P7YAY2_9HELO|nr:Metallo-dependent phosphatase-like protein [Amylocarpus encephaloides]
MAGNSIKKRKTTWPWTRRRTRWDPPTALDKFLDSPLRAWIHFIYYVFLSLRGAPFRPHPNKPKIRVVCISDTHSNTLPVAYGDVLIHAGDLTNNGTVEEIQVQLDWLDSLPHKEKIVIAGNHDSYFDTKSRRDEDRGKKPNFRSIHYLENQGITLKFKGGRKIYFYGTPDIPKCGGRDFAFQYDRETPPWGNRIPRETDVLITHTPPRYHLDLDLGCPGLLNEIWQVRPKLHVFGHVHSGHGREAVFWDEGQVAYERLMARKKGGGIIADLIPSSSWLDALKVVWYGFKGVLWQRLMVGPSGGNGGLLLNAAVVYQGTTDVGNPVQVIEL